MRGASPGESRCMTARCLAFGLASFLAVSKRFNMPIDFQVLAYEDTPLGPLCLRRRKTLSEPQQWVTEVTLNHEFLMSSLHTASEEALATIPLRRHSGGELSVLIGGLGLGHTAQAALNCPHVAHVQVVEYLPQVIQWMQEGLTPLAGKLLADERLRVVQGDVYERLLSPCDGSNFDVVLIDVDHSPQDQLAPENARFYTADGLRRATAHLRDSGVLAMWSYEQDTELLTAMEQVFSESEAMPIAYYNQHVQKEFVDWLYVGRLTVA